MKQLVRGGDGGRKKKVPQQVKGCHNDPACVLFLSDDLSIPVTSVSSSQPVPIIFHPSPSLSPFQSSSLFITLYASSSPSHLSSLPLRADYRE